MSLYSNVGTEFLEFEFWSIHGELSDFNMCIGQPRSDSDVTEPSGDVSRFSRQVVPRIGARTRRGQC